jgi:hypothetical protein
MTQLIKFFREIIIRMSHESPALFKKFQWISGLLTTLIPALLGMNEMFDWGWGLIMIVNVPLTYILSGSTTFLIGIFATSMITVDDKEKLNERL